MALLALAWCGLLFAAEAGEGESPRPPRRREKPKEEKEEEKKPLKIRAQPKGGTIADIRREKELDVGDCLEVRRENRLVGYVEVTGMDGPWPKLGALVGSPRVGDDLVPLSAAIPDVQLLTDQPNAIEAKELKALLGDKLFVDELGEKIVTRSQCTVRIIAMREGIHFMSGDQIAEPFAREGRTVILDTLAYSHARGTPADPVYSIEPPTIRIVREEALTAGIPSESRIPWYGTRDVGKETPKGPPRTREKPKPREKGKDPKGKEKGKEPPAGTKGQYVARYWPELPQAGGSEKLIATDDSTKNCAILDIETGGGRMLVLDLISLNGRAGRDPGAKNKLLFVARAIGSGPRYARYIPSRPECDDLLAWFDGLAEKHKEKVAKKLEGGGGRKEEFIHSFTIGPKEGPAVLLVACMDGTDWPAAVALQRLAEVLLENPERDPKIDWLTERLRVKIIPVVNVPGYRANSALSENKAEIDRNFPYAWDAYPDKKARGREPFSEAGADAIRRCVEKDKPLAFLAIDVDGYDDGYRIVRAREATEDQQSLLRALRSIVNARLRYRFVVGDQPLQLSLKYDAERPSAANWLGTQGILAASLRICGDGEDILANNDVAIEGCLHFLYTVALSREKPEPPPEKPAKPPKE